MSDKTFQALVVTETEPKKFERTIETRSTAAGVTAAICVDKVQTGRVLVTLQ